MDGTVGRHPPHASDESSLDPAARVVPRGHDTSARTDTLDVRAAYGGLSAFVNGTKVPF